MSNSATNAETPAKTLSIEEIATTKDTGDPVFHAELGDAWADIIVADARLYIHFIEATGDTRMSELMDALVTHFGNDIVQFMNPLDDVKNRDPVNIWQGARDDNGRLPRLDDLLDGFRRAKWTSPEGVTVECYVGKWDANRDR